jgi:hypothetical protein
MSFEPSCPEGCRTSADHERELVKDAELLESKARVLLESEARIGLATANQMLLAAIKARKEAGVLALARENAERDEWLMREYRKMKGFGDPETIRSRLRRKA